MRSPEHTQPTLQRSGSFDYGSEKSEIWEYSGMVGRCGYEFLSSFLMLPFARELSSGDDGVIFCGTRHLRLARTTPLTVGYWHCWKMLRCTTTELTHRLFCHMLRYLFTNKSWRSFPHLPPPMISSLCYRVSRLSWTTLSAIHHTVIRLLSITTAGHLL